MVEQNSLRAASLRNHLQLFLSVTALFAVFALLNVKTLAWPFGIVDTPILIAQAILYSPIEYFTSPSAYDFLSYNNFTPLATFSWDIDYTLFDLNETAFRAHQILALLALLALIYRVLLLATNSIVVTTLFCFGIMNLPATYAVLDNLVNRHYIEGMIFALLSYLTFKRYDQQGHIGWLLLSVICYGVAASAKEVYLPLPGLLFFLQSGSVVKRIYSMIPYALMLGAYLALRVYMIGGSGGYSGVADTGVILGDLNVLSLIAAKTLGGLLAQPLASISLLVVAVVLVFRDFQNKPLTSRLAVFMGLLAAVLPLLALLPMLSAGFISARWFFVPSVLLLLYLAHLCSQAHSPRLTALVCFIVLSSSAIAAYERVTAPTPAFFKGQGRSYQAILQSDENRFVLFSKYSLLAAENYSVWVYVAKLRNGRWGTLPIVTPGQAAYHDLESREPIPMGHRARRPDFLTKAKPLRQHVIKQVETSNGLVTFTFNTGLPGDACSVYLFNEYNGIVFGMGSCKQWVSSYRQISFQLRKAGMTVDNVQFAIWSEDPEHPWRSTPLPLKDLLAKGKH